jgi:hypothetical protein
MASIFRLVIKAISVVLNLSGQVGSIIRWEKFAVEIMVNGVIANTTNGYASFCGWCFWESTYYRVMIQTGTCITYSSQFYAEEHYQLVQHQQ